MTTKTCHESKAKNGSDSGAFYCPHHRDAVLGSDSSRFTVRVFWAWSVLEDFIASKIIEMMPSLHPSG
nr:MAG TPA: hypothetical protein [Caudoviricetes sp.]